jgi:hypothetical protein
MMPKTVVDTDLMQKEVEGAYLKALLQYFDTPTPEGLEAVEKHIRLYAEFIGDTSENIRRLFIVLQENDPDIWRMFSSSIESGLYGDRTDELKDLLLQVLPKRDTFNM